MAVQLYARYVGDLSFWLIPCYKLLLRSARALWKDEVSLTNDLGHRTPGNNRYLRRRTLAYNGFHRRP